MFERVARLPKRIETHTHETQPDSAFRGRLPAGLERANDPARRGRFGRGPAPQAPAGPAAGVLARRESLFRRQGGIGLAAVLRQAIIERWHDRLRFVPCAGEGLYRWRPF